MRHYEIVLLVHPDQSEQVPAMVERYTSVVTEAGGARLGTGLRCSVVVCAPLLARLRTPPVDKGYGRGIHLRSRLFRGVKALFEA